MLSDAQRFRVVRMIKLENGTLEPAPITIESQRTTHVYVRIPVVIGNGGAVVLLAPFPQHRREWPSSLAASVASMQTDAERGDE